MVDRARKVFDCFLDFTALLGGLIIAFLLVVISVSVISRYFFHKPIGWVIQISEYCVAVIAFLGAGWLERLDSHIKVELLLGRLNEPTRKKINVVTSFISMVFCAFFIFFGIKVVLDLMQRGVRSVDILEVPMAPFIAVIPLGLLLLFIQYGRNLYKMLSEHERPAGPGEKKAPVDKQER